MALTAMDSRGAIAWSGRWSAVRCSAGGLLRKGTPDVRWEHAGRQKDIGIAATTVATRLWITS